MVENGSGKILPQNLDAETAVIGAILAFPDCLNDVIAITAPIISTVMLTRKFFAP